MVSVERLFPLKGGALGGLGRGEAVAGKGRVAVPGAERSAVLLGVRPLPMPAAVVVEDNGRIRLGPQEEAPVLNVDAVSEFLLYLFQPNGGIVAPGSAIIVIDQDLQAVLAHAVTPVARCADWGQSSVATAPVAEQVRNPSNRLRPFLSQTP